MDYKNKSINSVEQNHSWAADSRSVDQEITPLWMRPEGSLASLKEPATRLSWDSKIQAKSSQPTTYYKLGEWLFQKCQPNIKAEVGRKDLGNSDWLHHPWCTSQNMAHSYNKHNATIIARKVMQCAMPKANSDATSVLAVNVWLTSWKVMQSPLPSIVHYITSLLIF